MTRPHRFAIAALEELWSIDRDELLERRLVHGVLEDDGERIDARDTADEELVERAEAQLKRCRSVILTRSGAEGKSFRAAKTARNPGGGSDFPRPDSSRSAVLGMTPLARLHTEARRVGPIVESATIILTIGGMSVVTTPEYFADDARRLYLIADRTPEESLTDYRGVPLLWKSGSASVLLHEAAGHAAEHGHDPIVWPDWLTVRDEPSIIDDLGDLGPAIDLLTDAPRSMRRESFVHPVLPRMSRMIVRHERAPFALPDRHVVIHLVAGGHYEPLTEIVSVFVSAADLVRGGKTAALQPFAIHETRANLARSLAGARGDAIRYPGVICSREGQELVVGSAAPEMVTVF